MSTENLTAELLVHDEDQLRSNRVHENSDEVRLTALEVKLDAYVRVRYDKIKALRAAIAVLANEAFVVNQAWDAEDPGQLGAVFSQEEVEFLHNFAGYGMYGTAVRR